MNKEELKQEAEEYCADNCGDCYGCHKKYRKNKNCEKIKSMITTYLVAAEPRERRIKELNQKLEQIKNEKFEKALSQIKHDREVVIEYNEKLQKENAKLKKDKKELCHSISEGGKACVYLNEQLTKAKDHIKKLLGCLQQDTNDPQTNYYVCQYMDKAEQFLSEVKK